MENRFKCPKNILPDNHDHYGSVAWQSPSNIALIKYWGKRPVQIPQNASISFTLSDARSETKIAYQPRSAQENWIDFTFDGQEEPSFAAKIESYFGNLDPYFPFLKQFAFEIESKNTFPHSSGIASSASAMSALAMCLSDMERILFGDAATPIDLPKASYIARLGSGSASRSVYSNLAVWGATEYVADANDLYAIEYSDVHDIYKTFHDDVLIVSADKKSVSSSAGHQLMETNTFASSRYQQADANMKALITIMKTDDLNTWGKIVESEAMTLHALMMCSDPSFILMKPETLIVIDALRGFRKTSGLPVFFTLDAGPNVHILYPDTIKLEVADWIENLITSLPEPCYLIKDHVGQGPSKIE